MIFLKTIRIDYEKHSRCISIFTTYHVYAAAHFELYFFHFIVYKQIIRLHTHTHSHTHTHTREEDKYIDKHLDTIFFTNVWIIFNQYLNY